MGKFPQILILLAVFLCFFTAEYFTPFHSDDFSYAQMGIGLESHLRHYLFWSGRVVADFASTIILALYEHHILTSLIIALISTLECALVAGIAAVYTGSKFSFKNFSLVAALYWVCNPNIGQINFWVVGACNYLITTTLIALLLYVFAKFQNGVSVKVLPLFAFLAVVAGCTNENSTLGLLYVLCAYCILRKLTGQSFSYRFATVIIICALIGTLILICAPGNFVRLHNSANDAWNALSFLDKAHIHLRRIGDYVEHFQYLLIFYAAELLLMLTMLKNQETVKRIRLSLLFFSASLVTFAVMVLSPSFPPRAYSGTFMFLLVAFSILMCPALLTGWKKLVHHLFCAYSAYLFVITFVCIVGSYSISTDQSAMRNAHLNYEKLTGNQNSNLTIPSYFFVKVQKDGDFFDLYNSGAMKDWFHVERIDVKWLFYDYSIATTGKEIKVVNNSHFSDVKAFQKDYIFSGRKTLLLTSETPLPERLQVKYFGDRDATAKTLTLEGAVKIMDRYYIGLTDRMDDISSLMISD